MTDVKGTLYVLIVHMHYFDMHYFENTDVCMLMKNLSESFLEFFMVS